MCASFKVFLYVKRAKKNKIQRKKEAQAAADSEAAAQAAADPDTGSEIGDLSQDDSHKLGGSYGENG